MTGPPALVQFTEVGSMITGKTMGQLSKMSAMEQLDYVKLFFANRAYRDKNGATRLGNIDDFNIATHWPAAIGKPDDFVLYKKDDGTNHYLSNQGLDANHDGQVTKAEASAKARAALTEGMTQTSGGGK